MIYWGTTGAGILPFCLSTKRFLIPKRSQEVMHGGTYGVWGGKIESDENPEDAAKREFYEETKSNVSMDLLEAHIFVDGEFKYHNFIGLVEEEFEPKLNWETSSFEWLTYQEVIALPNKHFGLMELLDKSSVLIAGLLIKQDFKDDARSL